LSAEQRNQLSETISRTVDGFVAMTQEILDYARGEQTLRLEPLNIEAFLLGFKESVARDFAEADIEIRLEMEYRGGIQADRQKLWRAFYNVAKNAAEAMHESASEKLFSVTSRRIGSWVEFGLADTGPGISPDVEKRMFQPFASYGKTHGTGLGLSISRSIVEAHKGEISVTTELGKGTTFFIRLPVGETHQ
jgi:signal transduction histidine kinase